MASLVTHVADPGLMGARPHNRVECFEAGAPFARVEGIIPAPEAAHAIKGAADEVIACHESGESKATRLNLCGHGHLDLQAYTDYFAGNIVDQSYSEEEVAMALAGLTSVGAA